MGDGVANQRPCCETTEKNKGSLVDVAQPWLKQ
jgi:hypothetical protein